ncbi:MAG: DUF4886 domain-containing protein [Anaerolineae bacterium]|jgi:hypothetical protein
MRFPRLLLFASALYLLTCCSGADAGVEAGQPLRVLFIGNSYTFHNNMPEMLAQLMRAGGRDIEVQSSARGGWTLADHAASEETLSMLMSQNWDYVILQEQSVIPCIPARREQLMYPAVRAIHDEVQRAGAETVLFVTWGRRDGLSAEGYRDYEMMQDQLNSGYMEIGTEVGAVVAPVGIAWQNARTADTQLQLWDRDGSHPSQEGSYLAACVFYSVICGESPEGTGYWGGLPVGTAQFLQRIAAETALD